MYKRQDMRQPCGMKETRSKQDTLNNHRDHPTSFLYLQKRVREDPWHVIRGIGRGGFTCKSPAARKTDCHLISAENPQTKDKTRKNFENAMGKRSPFAEEATNWKRCTMRPGLYKPVRNKKGRLNWAGMKRHYVQVRGWV